VRVGAAHEHRVQHTRQRDVVSPIGPPGYEGRVFLAP
jgi:hypothetical protein